MLKRFNKPAYRQVVLSVFFLIQVPLSAANFSIDHTGDPSAFNDVIRSSNALFPGVNSYNTVFVRSDFNVVDPCPVLRQNIDFNILNTFKLNFLSPLESSASIIKSGFGELSLSSECTLISPLILKEGTLNLAHMGFLGTISCEGGYLELLAQEPLARYQLRLSGGDVFIETPQVNLDKSIELTPVMSYVYLQNHGLKLNQGLSGDGFAHFFGPGQLVISNQKSLSGDVFMSDLDYLSSSFAQGVIYHFNDVHLTLTADTILMPGSSLDIPQGTLRLDQGEFSLDVAGPLTGPGTVLVSGSGGVNYHPPQKFEGLWIQNQGLFSLNGALADLTIGPEGQLEGSGTIGQLDLQGTLYADIQVGKNQGYLKTDSVNLEGTIILKPVVGHYEPADYLLVSSDDLTFNLKSFLAPAQFEGALSQEAEGLKYHLKKFHSLSDLIDPVRFDDKALTQTLDNFFAPPLSDIDHVIANLLSLENDPIQLANAINGLQPAYFSALGLAQESNFILARSALSNRMQELIAFPCVRQYVSGKEFSLWLDPVGDFTQQESNQNDMGYNAATIGAFLGFDGKIHPKFRLGVTAGYTNSCVDWMESVGEGTINSVYLASYFLYKPSNFYLNGSINGGYSHYSASRFITINTIERTARHKNHGLGFSCDFEFGYVIKKRIASQPFIRQSYIGLYQAKFSETGAADLNLDVNSKYFSMYRVEAGVIFNQCLNYTRWTLTPEISLSGIYEQELKSGSFHATYQDTDHGYDVMGMRPKRLLFSPGAALDFLIKKYPLMLGIRYHAELSPQFYDQRISGHVAYNF